jgi:heme-degrading monooxygenase HmoA
MSRDRHLDKVPGFVEFHLLVSPTEDYLRLRHRLGKRVAFETWMKSEAFRAAHSRARDKGPAISDTLSF